MIRTFFRVLLFVVSGGALLFVSALLVLHAGVDARLVNSLAGTVIPGTTASVADVAGNYFSRLELRGVRIVRNDGVVLLQCDTARVEYSLRQLLSNRITIHRVQLIGPVVSLHQSASGSWNPLLPRPRKRKSSSPGKDRGPVIQKFSIHRGLAYFRSIRYQSPLTVRFSAQGSLDLPLLTVHNLIAKPDSSTVLASGSISLPLRGRELELLKLDLETRPIVFRELRSFVPDLDRPGGARIKAVIRGQEPHAAIQGDLYDIDPTPLLGRRGAAKPMSGRVSGDVQGKSLTLLSGNTRLELSGGTHRVRAHAELDLGRARVDVAGKVGIAAGRITGWVRPFDPKPAYDLHARLRLPGSVLLKDTRWLGSAQRDVALRVRAEGLPPHNAAGVATVRLGPSRAALLDSGSIKAQLQGRSAEFTAQLGLADGMVKLEGAAGWASPLKLRVRRGTVANLNLAALLDEPRLAPLDGRFSLELDPAPAGIQLKVSSELNDAEVQVKARARLTGPRRRVTVSELRFSQFDLQRFLSTQPSTSLTGLASLQAVGANLKTGLLTGKVRLEKSRIDRHELRQAHLQVRLDQGTVLAEGEVDAGAGRLAFSGTARPFDRRPSFRLQEASFADLDLGSVLNKDRFRTRLSGTLTSEGSGKNPKSARLVGKLDLRQSSVDRATIDSGRIEAGLDDGEFRLIGRLSTGGDSVVIGAALSPFEQHPRVTLVTLVPIAQLAAVFQPNRTLDAEGAALLAVSGELGRPDSMRLQAEVQANGRLGDFRLDSLGASVRLRDGVVSLDSLSLRTNVGAAGGSGTMGLFGNARVGPVNFGFAARVADLAPLTPYLGVADLGLDYGDIRITAGGVRDSLQMSLDLNTAGLAVGTRSVAHLAVRAGGQLSGTRLSSGTAEMSARDIRSGKSSLRSLLIQGRARGREIDLRAEALADARNKVRMSARVSSQAHATRVRLDTLIARIDHRRWTLTHPVQISYGDRIEVNDFRLSSGSRLVSLNGVIDPLGEQSFDAAIDSLRILPLARALGQDELDGVLNGSVSLRGPARWPRLRAEWDLEVNSRDQAAGSSGGKAVWGSDGLRLDAWVSPPKGDSLVLKGQLPLALSLESGRGLVSRLPGGQLVLEARARDVEVKKFQSLLDPEQVSNLEGRLSVDVRARGTLEAPQLSGFISLYEGKVQIPSLGATYRSDLKLGLSGQEVRVEQGRVRGKKGQMDLSGTVRLQAFPTLAFDIRSRVQDFQAASSNTFRAGLTGNLLLSGSGKAPNLSGTLQLHDTDFYLQAKNLQSSAEPVELSPEDLRILERRFGPAVAERSRQRRILLSNWGLGLDVSLSHNNWLRRRTDPVMAVELSGKAQVRKTPGEEIQVFGEIRPLVGRSFVQLMSRRFDLRSGQVTLNGPLKQVRLGLEAEYTTTEAGGSTPVVITAAVHSDTGKLDVKLGSRPSMRSADIASYLMTGRPASTDPTLKSDEQDVGTMGASLALGAALGTVAGRAGQRIGLDVVQVLQDRQGGQTVVGGKYVSPPLYLGFRQSIVPPAKSDRSTTSQQEAVEFEVEYAALRQMLVNLQGGGSDIRVFLRLRR